jgi:hypothetical protein
LADDRQLGDVLGQVQEDRRNAISVMIERRKLIPSGSSVCANRIVSSWTRWGSSLNDAQPLPVAHVKIVHRRPPTERPMRHEERVGDHDHDVNDRDLEKNPDVAE